jgi:hypothetical protein
VNGRPVFPDIPELRRSPGDRAVLSQALGSRPVERFLLDVISLPSCTLQAIDCLRVLDNAAFRHRVLDDVLVDRMFKNLDSIFVALAEESIDESHLLHLARCADELRQLAEQIATERGPVPAVARTDGRVTPLTSAVRLTRISARILPAGERARYDEEWQAELYELAFAGASRWAQLIYALRVLNEAWVLRAELKAPAPQRLRP